ncbi:hypothetical protein [Klebsiella michiganensis]|uniref:hypothetical protein n=1 Tax=Klebsiella michiganensis TaxID=1134687 RepID=UPI0029308093|nr:hypothetical protein [Klebsiella michiganensis]
MTDITELAQRNELLIANGQQTADLLRHLADNEIDSDYFAVVSECESYGTETDAELSITEFALRAAGYVDELVEALEKAQAGEKQWREVVDAFCTDDADWHNLTNSNNELIALLSQALCEQADRIAELESFRTAYIEWSDKTDWVQTDKRFGVVKPLGKHRADVLKEYIQHLESRTVKLPERYACELGYNAPDPNGDMLDRDDVIAAVIAAGIKVEADSLDADVSCKNQPRLVVAVHIDAGDFVEVEGQVYEVKETHFDDHDVTLWFVGGETLKCAAGCQIEVVSAPVEDE